MLHDQKIWVGTDTNHNPVYLLPHMSNRHGLIAGATGTGKTVTLKLIAEGFSQMGVPVFLSDIKGDLSGMVRDGVSNAKIEKRLAEAGVSGFEHTHFPSIFWDVYGEQGHPVRATIKEMGPMLLSRMLSLNDTQSGVLNILFRVAEEEGMLLLDLKDVKAMLAYLGENAARYTVTYGNVSKASVGAIQRALAVLEDQGGNLFFGEPSLKITDWMKTDENGKGYINILSCDKLFLHPLMYSSFLLWMLTELYEALPELGDPDKPKMVFFFDEAHLVFNDCSKQLLNKVEQVVRLIRSKGVGVYFITQNPSDIPMTILGQLGNRVQHALRAFTPLDQKAVKVAAQTFRANPRFDTETAISELKTGEALLSFLDDNGAPSIVQRATILPPQSFMGPITEEERNQCIAKSPYAGVYDNVQDRESAYEKLTGGAQSEEEAQQEPQQPAAPIFVNDLNAYIASFNGGQLPQGVAPQNLQAMYQPHTQAVYPNMQLPYQQPQQPVYQPNLTLPPQSALPEEPAQAPAAPALTLPEMSIPTEPVSAPEAPVLTLPELPYHLEELADQVTAVVENATPKAQGFMVFDPTTGQYIQKELETMDNNIPQIPVQQADAAQQPVYQQPVYQMPVQGMPMQQMPVQGMPMQQMPVQGMPMQQYAMPQGAVQLGDQPQTITQNVLMLDPTTGAYVQKTVTMAYNPATGQYVPVQTEAEAKAAAKAAKDALAAQEKAAKDAARAAKEEEAAARRQRNDELREERAERARANNSVLGRIKNTAISSATRTVTTKLTNTLLGAITGGGKKKR
ncbi:MAG: DUF853 family protein [Clostridia bacterium]|nr:DUF853 family protein [Clostridia bacterium]